MVKGAICVTTFTKPSGKDGTPMFSRPGKATASEYIVFKEPYSHEEETKVDIIPEEVLKQ